jgi:DNA adenine methylase
MKYMGSKARVAKQILPILLRGREDKPFVDLFVGGCNIADKVDGEVIACDNNKYLIALYKGLQSGLVGTTDIPKELYDEARRQYNNDLSFGFSDFEIGWIGYMASANGRFYEGGYSGISKTKIGTERNYIKESISGILKQRENIRHISFHCCNYTELNIPIAATVYADPPYQGTKQYATSKGFDYIRFWEYMRVLAHSGRKVFISEYDAPNDFLCIWEKSVKSSLSANGISGGNKESVERLFTLIVDL